MSEHNDRRYVWLDIETTGLDPSDDLILEVGIIITTPDLTEVARRSWVVYATIEILRQMDPKVQAMMCLGSHLEEKDVENRAIEFLHAYDATNTTLCGSGVGRFDRQFLRRDMPELEKTFHYRDYDVSAYRVQAKRLGIECPPKRERHRVFDDLEDSIAMAAWADSLMIGGAARRAIRE